MPLKRVLLVFIDGLGIGLKTPSINPMAAWPPKVLNFFQDCEPAPGVYRGGIVIPTDPQMGVDGIPQSATGQTSILTGTNAPEAVGEHINGFPTPELKKILKSESNIYLRAKSIGKSSQFANAFQPLFFKYQSKLPHSCTTTAALGAGLKLKNFDELKNGEAVYQEFTHESLISKGFELPMRSPEEAGTIMAEITEQEDLTVYEYFQTDRAGHSGKMERAVSEIKKLDAFLTELLDRLDLSETGVILTSDHGNIEDCREPHHTLNPVPTILWGPDMNKYAGNIKSIKDIAGVVINMLESA